MRKKERNLTKGKLRLRHLSRRTKNELKKYFHRTVEPKKCLIQNLFTTNPNLFCLKQLGPIIQIECLILIKSYEILPFNAVPIKMPNIPVLV